jgi:hypothetical protein
MSLRAEDIGLKPLHAIDKPLHRPIPFRFALAGIARNYNRPRRSAEQLPG